MCEHNEDTNNNITAGGTTTAWKRSMLDSMDGWIYKISQSGAIEQSDYTRLYNGKAAEQELKSLQDQVRIELCVQNI